VEVISSLNYKSIHVAHLLLISKLIQNLGFLAFSFVVSLTITYPKVLFTCFQKTPYNSIFMVHQYFDVDVENSNSNFGVAQNVCIGHKEKL
jgi:hypothetical protein